MSPSPFLHFSPIALRRLLTLYFVIAFLSYGCGTPYQNAKYPFYHNHDIVVMDDIIQEGKTTKDEVLRQLGRPTIDTNDTLGRKKWIYLSDPYRGSEVRLDVIFDKDGVVVDHRLDSGDGGGEQNPL